MLLGKELNGFVKGLVTPTKTSRATLLRVRVYMGWIFTRSSTLANNKLPGQRNVPVLSVFPDLLTTVSETNYLMDVNTDETPNLSPPHTPPRPLASSAPNRRRQWWARCCPALLSLKWVLKLHGTMLLRASSRKHLSKDHMWWVSLTAGAPPPTGSRGALGLEHEKLSDVKLNL